MVNIRRRNRCVNNIIYVLRKDITKIKAKLKRASES